MRLVGSHESEDAVDPDSVDAAGVADVAFAVAVTLAVSAHCMLLGCHRKGHGPAILGLADLQAADRIGRRRGRFRVGKPGQVESAGRCWDREFDDSNIGGLLGRPYCYNSEN